jgi:hypothetical protein
MTSNLRRSSWTTRRPRDRPPRSTPRPQVEDALCSSCCLHAHHNRNCRVLRWPLPLLPPTPTMTAKARVRARGRGKARTTTPTTTAVTIAGAPRRGPPSTIPGSAPSRYGQKCILRSSSRCVHHNTPCLQHRHTTGLPAVPPLRPCQLIHRTSSKPRLLFGRLRRARGIISYWPTSSTPWH